MKPIPLLLLSDSVDCHSGLARITRDIAFGLSKMPEFRVATMGRGGRGTMQLPYPQYVFSDQEGWGEPRFEEIWRDFSRGELGILFTVWDASRLRYLVDPRAQFFPQNITMKFQRWGYFPIDATGPNNRLTGVLADTMSRFNRVLAYGMWSKGVIERSVNREVDWIPHGINMNTFTPKDVVGARLAMRFSPEHKVIGMVATNQTRKDWGLAFAVFDALLKRRADVRFWIHIDEQIRHWNIPALVHDYNLKDYIRVTHGESLSDTELSWMYSACDLTILPSSEGYGYPIVESMACGTPVVHSNYAGGAELISNKSWLIEPRGYRLEGQYNCLRPTWDPEDWVERILSMLENEYDRADVRRQVEHLDWANLWPVFKRWFLKGLTDETADMQPEQAAVST